MHNFTVASIDGRYMFWLRSSQHQATYIRNVKGNYTYTYNLHLCTVHEWHMNTLLSNLCTNIIRRYN